MIRAHCTHLYEHERAIKVDYFLPTALTTLQFPGAQHVLVQKYLNRSEQVWKLVTNGSTLRLLRTSAYLRRQTYVECDVAQILDEQRLADIAALYRLLHCTRRCRPPTRQSVRR